MITTFVAKGNRIIHDEWMPICTVEIVCDHHQNYIRNGNSALHVMQHSVKMLKTGSSNPEIVNFCINLVCSQSGNPWSAAINSCCKRVSDKSIISFIGNSFIYVIIGINKP